MNVTQRRILEIVATDRTFEKVEHRGRQVWMGKCLHCNAHLCVELDGTPISRATVEHIVPRVQGGTDELENLGLACARCNHQKGIRHDRRGGTDLRAAEVMERLLQRRQKRWRPA